MSFVKGLAKLNKQFAAIEVRIVKKSLRSVLTKAGTPMLRAAKQEAPVRLGHLKKALRKRVWQNTTTAKAGVVVGVADDYRVPNPDWKPGSKVPKTFFPKNYLHLVIFGTAAHVAKDGATIAAASPNDFLTRAKTQTQTEALRIIRDGTIKAVKAAAQTIGGAS